MKMTSNLSFIRVVNIKILSKIVNFQINTIVCPQLLSADINSKIPKICPTSLVITVKLKKKILILNIKEKK